MLLFFFFNHTAPTEIYTLSLHDALPISAIGSVSNNRFLQSFCAFLGAATLVCSAQLFLFATWDLDSATLEDRKSTRLNSSHVEISYAVFCLKKKKKSNYRGYIVAKNVLP